MLMRRHLGSMQSVADLVAKAKPCQTRNEAVFEYKAMKMRTTQAEQIGASMAGNFTMKQDVMPYKVHSFSGDSLPIILMRFGDLSRFVQEFDSMFIDVYTSAPGCSQIGKN
jgi:hypothetical protein